MAIRKYGKLVRDNIPEIIARQKKKPVTHRADDEEFGRLLAQKLLEEAAEFVKSHNPEELADILEVLEAICAHEKIGRVTLGTMKADKARERGKFEQRIILDEVQD